MASVKVTIIYLMCMKFTSLSSATCRLSDNINNPQVFTYNTFRCWGVWLLLTSLLRESNLQLWWNTQIMSNVIIFHLVLFTWAYMDLFVYKHWMYEIIQAIMKTKLHNSPLHGHVVTLDLGISGHCIAH